MLGMSRAGLAERWTLFVGALLSVALGVALVQSSLLLLISAAGANSDDAAVPMLGITLGGATFLAGFIISSTFAFTVDQRRRDLALLRLVGGSRGQVRRLLLGEALLLGLGGAAIGVPAGLGVMSLQTWLMRRFEFVPPDFVGEWRMWILGVSIGTGVVLALAGVLVAARRAARVRPLEALRESGAAARLMTAGRWVAGLFFLGGALALVIVAPHGGPAGGQAMAMNVAMPAAVTVVAFGPLLVPVLARLMPFGGGVLGALARANVRDARRRSASVAAPLIVLIALVVGNTGAGESFTSSGIGEVARSTHADFVVEAPVPARPGVATVSSETMLPAEIVTGSGEDRETTDVTALAINPRAYAAVHGTPVELTGNGVARGPGGEVPTDGSVRVRLLGLSPGSPGADLGDLPVVAAVPEMMSGGASLLMLPGQVPAALLEKAPTRSFVALEPGADASAVRADLARFGPVSTLGEWLKADAEERNSTNDKVMLVVLGLGGLYALIGVINSMVIGAATRRREFAEARVTGLTRSQVIRSALLEAYAVTGAALLLGALAASAAFFAVLSTTSAVTGTATLDLPWPLIAAVAAVALTVTGVTSLITSWSATRHPPVTLLAARE
ncbi:FtsX-like permease family protein [Actinoplanes sp. TRM 88003]|uniref:FtsX-like permease family protein n=1 Tax=Paractinoplanes aksuensis TaxID=2939490 RepID=A0ABT1E302_9ACTN|nr:FtsX-like permease family protein [Actinoplanes aksuensis]MCO8276621.1 FtsX-like permease family protein [Actinoplanes aksuensis]